MQTSESQRQRPHPDSRFAAPATMVDLTQLAARLRAETNAGERGHRQETCFKHGHVTVALFTFDRFTHLPEHVTRGVVSMQVLKGRVKITANDTEYELKAGQLLALAGGVRHAVKAEEESEMLVSVCLDP